MPKPKAPALDPELSSILASIRATVTGEPPPLEPATEAPPATVAPPSIPPASRTVEAFLADLIRPHVEAWLDRHLPEIVQKLAADEIRRLTGK
ncbi:DUF2497 domain-containing protein [Thermaurantiacus sp.]